MTQHHVRRRRLRAERGAELIEFAVAFPLLFFLVAGIVDFGFMFHNYEVVTNAAREGARIGILPNYTTADVQARVASYLTAAGLTGTPTTNVSTTTGTLPSGATVKGLVVQVNYPYSFGIVGNVARFFGAAWGGITLHAISIMRQEIPAG
jgi:Flp pilus assembly protein TadG